MRLQLKHLIGALMLAAVTAMLVAAMGTSAYATPGFRTSGTFPVEFLGEGLGLSTFLSEGLSLVTCENSHSKGAVLSSTLAKVTILYLNACLLSAPSLGIHEACPDITTNELLLTPLSNLNLGTKLGLLVLPKSGTVIALFICSGANKVHVKVTGAVVCESTPGGQLVSAGKVICKGGARHGSQEFTSGEDPTGSTMVGGTLTAESTSGIFKFKEPDSQTTTEDVTYNAPVEQTH